MSLDQQLYSFYSLSSLKLLLYFDCNLQQLYSFYSLFFKTFIIFWLQFISPLVTVLYVALKPVLLNVSWLLETKYMNMEFPNDIYGPGILVPQIGLQLGK